MKLFRVIILNMVLVFLLSTGVNGATKLIVDDAKVLKQETINTVETNLEKIEKNTEVTVKFDIVKSLDGKNIDDYAKQYAKDTISNDKYILFVSSIGDKKNKLLVSEKTNSILSKSDIETIVSLPNQDFKSSNYDAGIMKVGKALDEKVTTKAVKTGKAEVSSDGYSTQVEHKTKYLKIFLSILLVIGVGVVIFILVKRKINNDYEKRKKEFAAANNLDSYLNEDDSFHSADVSKKEKANSSFSMGGESSSTSRSNYNTTERTYNDSSSRVHTEQTRTSGGSTINNTTIVNENSNNDRFVEGMLVGNMLSNTTDHHHDHYDHHDYDHNDYDRHHHNSSSYEDERTYEKEEKDNTTYTSGNWDNDSSVSSWGSSSNNEEKESYFDSNSNDDSSSYSSSDSNDSSDSSDW